MNGLKWVIYTAAFFLGTALMAFEILVSRMLYPFFGGGIYTWSALISVVLFAMMVGYFFGGWLVDRTPTLKLGALFATIAGLWFIAVPLFQDAALTWIIQLIENERVGVMLGSALLQFVPVAALGTFSPIAIRVTLSQIEQAGSTAGTIYAVSTTGNVIGTIGAALVLIPNLAISTAVYALGGVCLACAALLWIASRESAPIATPMRPAE